MIKDDYTYINRFYGLNITTGTPVVRTSTGQHGHVAASCGSYIRIKWEGTVEEHSGTWHPTWDLEYPGMTPANK